MSEKLEVQRPTNENIKTNIVTFQDASSEVAKTLPPQLGTDPQDLMDLKFDVRRLTDINELERLWITYFLGVPKKSGGEYAKQFAIDYMNLSMSLNGKRAELLVKMQGMASGLGRTKPVEDKRDWLEKHITKRGEKPTGETIDV